MPGLGFPLGTRGPVLHLDPHHPNALAPGKRPRTTLTPSLALKDGQPYMVFGTPGGDQQDQWTLQFFLNFVDFGMDLQAAIDAPTVPHAALPHLVLPARGASRAAGRRGALPEAVRADLAARGHEVVVGGDWELGQVNVVRFHPDSGRIEGGASPRSMVAYAMGR